MLETNRSYPCVVINAPTPDGDMFVVLTSDDYNKLIDVQIHIGKSGSSLAAWTNALGIMMSALLARGGKASDLIILLSNITSQGMNYTDARVPIRSAVDGIVYALQKYEQDAYDRLYKSTDPRSGHDIFHNRDHFER